MAWSWLWQGPALCWSVWTVVEVFFYIVFHSYLKRRANQRTIPTPYRRPYDTNKRVLLERIVQRILHDRGYSSSSSSSTATEADRETQVTVLAEFLLAWFRKQDEEEPHESPESPLGGTTAADVPHTNSTFAPGESKATNVKSSSSSPAAAAAAKRVSSSSSSLVRLPRRPSRQPSATYSSASSSDDEASSGTASDSNDYSSDELLARLLMVSASSSASSSAAKKNTQKIVQYVAPTPAAATDCSTTTTVTVTKHDAGGYTIPGMTTQQIRSFLAWGFFAADETNLNDTERLELQLCVDYLHDEIHVYGDDENPPLYLPRRMTLEDLQPWHRPFLVYVMVYLLRCVVAAVILRLAGFRPVQSSTGLRGWVRTASSSSHDDDEATTTPLIFFHGIAPAAILLYLPLVLLGLRAPKCLLIENPNISCTLSFTVLSETDTVDGVQELVARYFGGGGVNQPPVVLAGHSFGSCPITWILNNDEDKKKMNVRDVILLDPVTILLSESDVMINFLYAHEKVLDKIRMVASSELFTEYYLRRHFAWYNSELWLDEHQNSTTTFFVGLAEDDEIVNARKVHRHIVRHQQQQQQQQQGNSNNTNHGHHNNQSDHHQVDVHVWEQVGHGSVVMDAHKWPLLRQRLAQSKVFGGNAVAR
jgi:hypothetical protein